MWQQLKNGPKGQWYLQLCMYLWGAQDCGRMEVQIYERECETQMAGLPFFSFFFFFLHNLGLCTTLWVMTDF